MSGHYSIIAAVGRIWLAALFIGGIANVSAQTSMLEYHVKALFLLNFVKYVDWPETSFAGSGSPIIIGILG
jgi:hypothetical protein